MNRARVCAGARRWRALVGTLIAGVALIASANASATTVTISGTPSTTIATGSTYSFTPKATVSTGAKAAFAITGKPSWATFNSSTGQLTGKPSTAGKYSGIGIEAYSGTAVSKMLWFGITVTGSSTPPSGTPPPGSGPLTLSGSPPTTVAVNTTYTFTPTATDSAGLKPTFAITGKPSWASFNTSTGQLTGKPTATGSYGGIGIQAGDGKNFSAMLWFGITVTSGGTTPTVTISGSPSTAATVGKGYSFQPTAKDSAGKALSFSVQNKPSWASFSISSGLLSGTPTSAQTNSNILISASDGTSSASMAAFTVIVSNTTAPPGGTGAATLSWTLPTQNTNGSALTNLAGVRLYYGTSSTNLSHQIQLAGTSTTTYMIDNLAAGTWYFGAAAYNTAGTQSALSAIASKTIQ